MPLGELVEHFADSQLAQHLGDQIEFSPRNPAAEHEHLLVCEVCTEPLTQHLLVIGETGVCAWRAPVLSWSMPIFWPRCTVA